jgi:hypothetical protein
VQLADETLQIGCRIAFLEHRCVDGICHPKPVFEMHRDEEKIEFYGVLHGNFQEVIFEH